MRMMTACLLSLLPASVLLGATCWNNTFTCSVVSGGCASGGTIRRCDAGCNPVMAGWSGYTNPTVGPPVAATCTDFTAAPGAPSVFSQRNCALGYPGGSLWYAGNCGTVSGMCCFWDPNAAGASSSVGPNPGYKVYPCQKSDQSQPCTGT